MSRKLSQAAQPTPAQLRGINGILLADAVVMAVWEDPAALLAAAFARASEPPKPAIVWPSEEDRRPTWERQRLPERKPWGLR